MKILHYISGLGRELGGTVTSVINLCTAMAEHGDDITVLTADVSSRPVEWAAQKVELRHIGGHWMSPRSSVDPHALREFDVVHLHSIWDPHAVRIARTARKAGTPYIVSPRGTLDAWALRQSRLKKQLQLAVVGRRVVQHAALLHFTAQGELDQATRAVRFGAARIVPNVVELTSQSPPRQPVEGLRILFLSRLHPKKGASELIRSLPLVSAASGAVRLVVAGPDEGGTQRRFTGWLTISVSRRRFRFPARSPGRKRPNCSRAPTSSCFPLTRRTSAT